MSPIDFGSYLRLPSGSSHGDIVALAHKLEAAVPTSPSTAVSAAVSAMRVRADAYVAKRVAKAGAPHGNVQPALRRLQRTWGVCVRSVDARGRIADELGAKALEVAKVLAPYRIALVTGTADEVWTTSVQLLLAVSPSSVHEPLQTIVSDTVLSAVDDAHRALGEALGMDVAHLPASVDAPTPEAASLRRAIIDYTRVLIGEVNVDDDASVERFRTAVRPIDDLRAARASSAGAQPAPAPTGPATTASATATTATPATTEPHPAATNGTPHAA